MNENKIPGKINGIKKWQAGKGIKGIKWILLSFKKEMELEGN